MNTFFYDERAKAVDQDDFGLLLSVVEGEDVEGTGRQDEGAGAAALIEGQGSDKFKCPQPVCSVSYRQFCMGSWDAGAVKARWYWCMFTHFVGTRKHHNRVYSRLFCLSHQNTIWMFGSGLVQRLCEFACFVISQNSMKLRCHSSTSQNTKHQNTLKPKT
jgi:hypothetical protein